jgi:hypothetical protein
VKRSRISRTSKQPISKIQRELWEHVKKEVRSTQPNVCYTCGRTGLDGANWHSGHMWPKASVGAYLKYDTRIIRSQCYHCNINLGGNGAVFYARMLSEIGPKAMRKLEQDRNVTVKAYDFYVGLLARYRALDR